MRGNSASNYKTDAWLKIKILLAVVAIYTHKHHEEHNTFFISDCSWFTSTHLVLRRYGNQMIKILKTKLVLSIMAGAFDLLTSAFL